LSSLSSLLLFLGFVDVVVDVIIFVICVVLVGWWSYLLISLGDADVPPLFSGRSLPELFYFLRPSLEELWADIWPFRLV